MYQFVDTTAGSTSSASLSLNTMFNGHNLDQLLTDDQGSFTTLTVTGRSQSEQLIETINIMGMDGLLEQDHPDLTHRQIEVKYKITDKSSAGLRQRLSRLNYLLEGSKKQLQFTDEAFLFYATMQSHILPEEESNTLIASIVFLCSDPYKYGEEKESVFSSNTLKVNNEGTATAYPTFEFEVLAPITFAMVQNHLNEYLLLGYPVDEDEGTIVDTRQTILDERGEGLSKWNDSPTEVDPISGHISEGSFAYDGTGIIVADYGTPSSDSDVNGYGPAIIKELPEPVQDFELTAVFDTRTNLAEENFRIEIHLFDEGLNNLGKIGVRDGNRDFHNRRGLGRVGHYVDGTTRYLVGSGNFNYNDLGRSSMFFVRWRREGNQTTMYFAEVVNGVHDSNTLIERRFIDIDNEWIGAVKYAQIYIRSWRDRRAPYLARVNRLKIEKLAQSTENQIPYMAYPGDIITFDTKNQEMLLNGADVTALKDFGAHYFTLKTGENELILHPEEHFNTTVRYQERFK
ncbi:distal tail protein Dit [Amphibacillus cookii]|uniref:distal tail protein Dit n=1 Tax=Amphibacillus cookii TaxID=767787 RepID=UPI00195B1167|nr:distal tail protein Dit [Amphibacillus cookii]MBM7542354.1 putative phage tail component-like protein [Amphibacillus cookii]